MKVKKDLTRSASDIISSEELRNIPLIRKVEAHLSELFCFRYNEVTDKVELKRKNGVKYIPIRDYQINSMARKMQGSNIPCSVTLLRNLLFSDFVTIYNPFEEFFETLPEPEANTDYIQQLAETVKTTNDALWYECFRRWFVAMVACVLETEVVNQTVIVFSGKQGLGKTTWMLNLIPSVLKEYVYSGTINPSNKDTLIHLSECILINLDELENLNRSELGTMKEIITKNSIRLRRPYGYTNELLPRRASFAGSVNNREFLSDTTGSRRFLCFEVTGIDYHNQIPLDMAYAQALKLFKEGYRYWFSPTDIEAININNEQYRIQSVEEELLLTYFERCIEEDATHKITTTELVTYLSGLSRIPINDSAKLKLGKALRAHDFIRVKNKNRYVYLLRQKAGDPVGLHVADPILGSLFSQ